MELKEDFKKGFLVLIVRTIGAFLAFLSTIIFARLLGVEEFGIFSLAFTLVTVLSIFVRTGLENVVLKQVSVYISSSPFISNGYLVSSLLWIMFFGSFITLTIWLSADFIANSIFYKPLLKETLQAFSLMIVPISWVFLMASAWKSYKKPIYSSFVHVIVAPLVTLLVIAFLWLFKEITLINIILAILSGFIVSIVLYIYDWLKNFKQFSIQKQRLRTLLKEGYPMLLISSGALILAWSDTVILGLFASPSEIGIYTAASRTVLATSLVLVAINAITAPKYARLYAQNNIEAISDIAKVSSAILFVTVAFPMMFFFFLPEWVMSLFGKNYIPGALVLSILALGQFINVTFGSVAYLLSMTGKEYTLTKIMIFSSIVNIVLSIIVVKKFGYVGVAYVTALSTILWNTLALIAVKNHLGFWTIDFSQIGITKIKEFFKR